MKTRRLLPIAATVLAAITAACGGESSDTSRGAGSTRVVRIEMRDIAYAPATVDAKQGEEVRFVFTNAGKVDHDAFIGDTRAQAKHETEMREASGGHGSHGGDDKAITVKPGKTGEIVHRFDEAGTTQIGCHQPGHYAGGMKITVTVS